MSSENAKPDQIQASVAAALSRLRGDLGPAATPQPGSEQPRAANDLRADPFFKSIQSNQPQPSQPRAPIPMTPFTRMQAPQEPVPAESAAEASDPLVAEDNDPMPTMPEPMSSAPAQPSEPTMPEPTVAAMPEPEQAKPARQSVVERQAAPGGALSRMMMRGDSGPKPTGADPVQRDLLADLPPPPISEPLTADPENAAIRRRRRNRLMLGSALGVLILASGVWLWSGGESDTEVPVITAETTPEKVAPTEPGGVDVPNQNIQILNGTDAQPQDETVMPAPEQPVAPPQATAEPTTSEAPIIEEPRATGATTTTETNAAPPVPTVEAPTAETPAVDAPPAPEVPLANQPLPEQTDTATNAAPPAPEAEAPTVAAPATTEPSATAPTEQPAAQQTAEAPAVQAPAPAEQPAAEPAATQQASVAPSATGNARIQLAAVKSEAAAKTEWAKMQKAHPDLLGALTLTVQTVVKDGTTYYRIQAGPLADRNAAKQLCASLKTQKQDCIVAGK